MNTTIDLLASATGPGPGSSAGNGSAPVMPAEADALFAAFAALPVLCLAVSGGADSTALLHLAADWAGRLARPPRLVVLTVDHRLRPGAAAECAAVMRAAAGRGLAAEILVRPDAPIRGDVQAAARRARYALLAEAARRHGAADVLLAHQLDDQAETLLLRLARGSGLRGLGAMRPSRRVLGIAFHRPLLGVARARLVAGLRERGATWIDDPSNADDRYARVRLRALMPALAEAGLTAPRLAATARRLARAASLVEDAAAALRARAVTAHGGYASIDRAALAAAHPEAALLLLSDLVRDLRGADYGPRLAPLETVFSALLAGAAPVRSTVAGVVIDAARRDRLWLYPEAGRHGFEAIDDPPEGRFLWDGRITLELGFERNREAASGGLRVAALGAAGRRALAELGHRLPGPARAQESVPALFDAEGRPIAVPAAGYARSGAAFRIVAEEGAGTL